MLTYPTTIHEESCMEDDIVNNGKDLFGRIGHFGGVSKVIFFFVLLE